jgi:hypothetical protein
MKDKDNMNIKSKTFKKTLKQKAKIAPCDKYEGVHIEYNRNDKKYCRKKTKFAKEKQSSNKKRKKQTKKIINQSSNNKETSKENNKCLNLTDNDVLKYTRILNFNKENLTKHEFCNKISNIINNDEKDVLNNNVHYKTSLNDVLKTCKLLDIPIPYIKHKNVHKKVNELLEAICNKVMKYATADFKKMLSDLVDNNFKCNVKSGYIITKIIVNILYPNEFPQQVPIQISNNLYKELADLKKKKKLTNSNEQHLLNQSTQMKVCHKMKELLLNKKFTKDVINVNININNDIKNINKNNSNCKFYDWYTKLDYITNKTSNKNNNSKKSIGKYIIKKEQHEQKGGSYAQKLSPSKFCPYSMDFSPQKLYEPYKLDVDMKNFPNIFSDAKGFLGSGWA